MRVQDQTGMSVNINDRGNGYDVRCPACKNVSPIYASLPHRTPDHCINGRSINFNCPAVVSTTTVPEVAEVLEVKDADGNITTPSQPAQPAYTKNILCGYTIMDGLLVED